MSRAAACVDRASVTSETRTLPPPNGAKDMYSAPTRVGTLPENVLAAMRDRQASDENIVATRHVPAYVPPEPAAPPVSWIPLTPPPFEAPRGWEGSAVALVGPRPRTRFAGVMWSILVITAFAVLGAGVAVLIIAR